MNGSTWQAEKKKILTRLTIAIYKMEDEELVSLLNLFEEFEINEKDKLLNFPQSLLDSGADGQDRQILIARFFLMINQLSEADLIKFMSRYEQKRFAMLREFPRVGCNFPLDLVAGGKAINGFAMDISAGGLFIESSESFSMGQPVSICFTVGEESLPVKLTGRVVRLEQGGIGIEYESLTGYQREIMQNLISRLQVRDNTRG